MSDEWIETNIGQVARVTSGFPFSTRDWTESGIPVIKIKNVRDGQVTTQDCSFISYPIPVGAEKALLAKGNLLITLTGEIGAIGFVTQDEPLYLNQRVGRVQLLDDSAVNLEYLGLFFSLGQTRTEMWSMGKGNAQLNISPASIHGLKILLPPLTVQRRIVDLTTHLDTHIANLQAEVNSLSSVKIPLLAGFQSQEGTALRLGEVVRLEYGKALRSDDRIDGDVSVYGSAGLAGAHSDALLGHSAVVVGRKGANAPPSLPASIRQETALVSGSRYSGWGGAGSVRWAEGPHWVIDTAYSAASLSDALSPTALFWLLSALDLPRYATRTTLPGLSRDAVYSLEISLPSDLDDRVDSLERLDQAIVLLLNELRASQQMRRTLLSDLLNVAASVDADYDSLISEVA